MRIIYEPRGRAAEYAQLAASGYRRCNHGCHYCFNPAIAHCSPEEFRTPQIRQGVLTEFRKECEQLAAAGDRREILLSFSTDPYNELEDRYQITRGMIQILIENGLHFTILTKGKRPLRDIDLLQKGPALCRFGTTLTLIDEMARDLWEPGATSGTFRVESLQYAATHGIRTWASIEPVIYPNQSLELMRLAAPYCQEFRIGKLNHTGSGHLKEFMASIKYTPPTDEELIQFVKDAKELLEWTGRRGIFKQDMQPHLQAAEASS